MERKRRAGFCRTAGVVSAVSCVALLGLASVGRADTVAAVKAAGVLRCGSNGAQEDYTRLETHGDLTDLATEVCKAVAVAVMGPNGRSEVHDWPDEHHMLSSLQHGSTDLAIGATPSDSNAMAFGVAFAAPVFFDGLGILARNEVGSRVALAGRQICFLEDATVGDTLASSLHASNITYRPFPFQELGEMLAAAGGGHCAAIAGNVSQLINMRVGYAPIEKHFRLLPDVLTREPVAPAVRADDPAWSAIVGAVVNALIRADASGVTAENVDQLQARGDRRVDALTGTSGIDHLAELPGNWAVAMIRAVGNYDELYRRTLGDDSDFKLPRGANQPSSRGGLMVDQPPS